MYELCAAEGEEERHIRIRFFEDAGQRDSVGEAGEGVGGVFVAMGGLRACEESGVGVLRAENQAAHLCGRDLYAARWGFAGGMAGVGEGAWWWEVVYEVRGPGKGYVSTTRYCVDAGR